MNTPLFVRRDIQHGFSLVEMMVAITIGLLLLAGLGTVYLGSTQTFRQQEALARMQEGARYAFEVMTLEIRQAGYRGCVDETRTFSSLNVPVPPAEPNWFDNLATTPLMGYESGVGLPGVVAGELANTDSVAILRGDDSGNYRIAVGGHSPPSSANISLISNAGLILGEILTAVAADCSFAGTFQVTALPPGGERVNHDAGAGTPGNSTKCLGDPAGALCTGPEAGFPRVPDNSKIMRNRGTIFYLANGASNEPSLFREILTTDAGNAVSRAEELIEGVENMQILYGEDTSPIVAGVVRTVDRYVAADAAPVWNNVLAVRVSLLMRSVENNVVNQPQEVMFNGATVNSGVGADRRLRKVFTTTIAVRNRL